MRCVFAFLIAILIVGPVHADLPALDRTRPTEPVYQTKAPRYGLLVFGPKGEHKVWLVLDGDVLYVDRNGNSDLTEPGEKVRAQQRPGRDPDDGYQFEVGELTLRERTHKALTVTFMPLRRYASSSLAKRPDVQDILAKDPKAMVPVLSVEVDVPGMRGGCPGGRVYFMAGFADLTGVLQFAVTPAAAPAVHLGGPLQVTFSLDRPTLHIGRDSDLALVVGTPGVGPGTFAMIGYEDTAPAAARPVAEITYPRTAADPPPLRERVEIRERC
jgi:hypothetical protein